MLKEDLLIALLKFNQSHTEFLKSDDSNTEIGEKNFNNLRNNFSKEEIKKHREKFYKKERIYNYLKEKNNLSTKEKRILKKIKKYFKKLKKDLNKIKIYKYNITHDTRNLFNNKIIKKDYYEPIEIRSALEGNYIEYESRGDNDNFSLEEYLNVIRPYLRDMINNHKAQGEWKIQLVMKIKFISSLDDEFREMYTKSDNVEIMSGTETSDVINELFKSFFRKY